jgi:hypothetical protein
MTADPASELRPPEEYAHIAFHWLRRGDDVTVGIFVPNEGHWQLLGLAGHRFPEINGWAYWKPCDPHATTLLTEADVERIARVIAKALGRDADIYWGVAVGPARAVIAALKED